MTRLTLETMAEDTVNKLYLVEQKDLDQQERVLRAAAQCVMLLRKMVDVSHGDVVTGRDINRMLSVYDAVCEGEEK